MVRFNLIGIFRLSVAGDRYGMSPSMRIGIFRRSPVKMKDVLEKTCLGKNHNNSYSLTIEVTSLIRQKMKKKRLRYTD